MYTRSQLSDGGLSKNYTEHVGTNIQARQNKATQTICLCVHMSEHVAVYFVVQQPPEIIDKGLQACILIYIAQQANQRRRAKGSAREFACRSMQAKPNHVRAITANWN